MTRKRHAPESLLREVVERLEQEAERSPRAAVQALLSRGPLLCSDAFLETLQRPDAAPWGEIRAELKRFLGEVVREDGHGDARLGIYGPVNFSLAALKDGEVACSAEAGGDLGIRDLAALQLVLLLHEVGFGQVRRCRDIKCQRLFVRRYRQDFCSGRCQKRLHAYLDRLKERERLRREKQLKRRRAR